MTPPPGPHAAPRLGRVAGGARTESTERVTVRAPGFETQGWTLNVSRGGFRAIVEERLSAAVEYEVLFRESQPPRRASLVWGRDENDGQIVGMKYLDQGRIVVLDQLASPD